ncbi:MAG: arylsulfotransferase family protein, partial [Acidobacteriota bacterium]
MSTLTSTQVASAQAPDAEELEALRSLGYINRPPEAPANRAARKTGVVLNLLPHVASGFTLITVIPEAKAILVDNLGRVVRTWQHREAEQWARAILLENGDVLAIGQLPGDLEAKSDAVWSGDRPNLDPADGQPWYPLLGKYLARYGWDGTLHWRRGARAHHDLEVGDDGRILTLGLRTRTVDDLVFEDHSILVYLPHGELEKELSLFDLLRSNPTIFRLPKTTDFPGALRASGVLDLLHSNAVTRMPFPELRDRGDLYCGACVLVTVRHQNLLAVVDIDREKLVWVWGPGELQYPHEGRWLENGHLLVFDNGTRDRGYSRVVEVDPLTGEIVWSYQAKKPSAFFTSGRGTAQKLPNGNVLISSANQGRVFEVTPQGRTVWRYVVRGGTWRRAWPPACRLPRVQH